MSNISKYVKELEKNLKTGDSTEHTHRTALKNFLESLRENINAINEPKHIQCGAPDYKVVSKKGEIDSTVGYIEAKDIGRSLDEEEKGEQIKRYRENLPNLILTDYIEFRLYDNGERKITARIGSLTRDGAVKRDTEGEKKVIELLTAFLEHTPERITRPEDLARRMARITHMIKDIITETFERDIASPELKDLRKAFAKVLIPDMEKPENTGEFADMLAQTVAYGLFAARVNHKSPEPFRRRRAAEEIPKTNPFLRRLFDSITGVEMEEEPYALFVDDIVDLLNNTDVEEVLRHFGKKKRSEDPIIHFYETFLAAYDKKMRKIRGVYYTPEPVISYIVRSVDHILKTDFNLPDGLADTTKIKYTRKDENGEPVEDECHKVLILDPAGGTGSFLYHIIDLIRSRFMQSGNAGMWSGYVREHLLPRIFGFELLMAPYAVAHLKLGMQLAGLDLETEELRRKWRYDFQGDERLNIFLTNTLEEAERVVQKELELWGLLRIIADEAKAANSIKEDKPVLVIIGNPPYSGHSANEGEWIKELVTKEYYPRDDIKERNPKWLLDDYVKFIRWAQRRIEKTGAGILAFITNHSYIDNPTFRQMRKSLMDTFDKIYIYDLHGNVKKKEKAPDGSKDENVFDIQQGVAIGIFVKSGKDEKELKHEDLFGERESKYKRLKQKYISETEWRKLEPAKPFFFLKPYNSEAFNEYNDYWKINDIFPLNSVGIVTARDNLTIHYTEDEIWDTVNEFSGLSPEKARERFNLGKDAMDWKVELAQEDLRKSGIDRKKITPLLYRPFDTRYTYYTGNSRGFICRPRPEVMRHMIGRDNFSIAYNKREELHIAYSHFLITDCITEHVLISPKTTNYQSPLYLYHENLDSIKEMDLVLPDNTDNDCIPNINQNFINTFSDKIDLQFTSNGVGDLKRTFGPEDILHYIYAVFYSPTYRERYSEFLRIDFPRVPLTSDRELFRDLCRLGGDLVRLHLLKDISTGDLVTSFPERGSDIVEKGHPRYLKPGSKCPKRGKEIKGGRVYINKDQYFDRVEPETWEFYIGGYQVLHKWLKDRRGRKLDYDDKTHYQKVVYALTETRLLMKEIDSTIPRWPIE